MKKITLLLSFGIAACTAAAQNPITYCNTKPVSGDSLIGTTILADTTGVTPGNSGAGVTWDYSGLITDSTSALSHHWYDAASTPWTADFPNAQTGDLTPVDIYSYYSYNNDSAMYWGMEASAVNCMKLSDPLKQLICPFGFQASFSDSSIGYGCGSGMYTHHYANRTTTYDSYGKLILPNATYDNTIRLKSEETFVDSLFLGSGGFLLATTGTITIYSWNDISNPTPYKANVFNIIYSTTGVTNYKMVSYYDIPQPTGITSAAVKKAVEINPNPFRENTLLKITGVDQNSIRSVIILDVFGRRVRSYEDISSNQLTIAKENLQAGIYFYTLTENGLAVANGKIILE